MLRYCVLFSILSWPGFLHSQEERSFDIGITGGYPELFYFTAEYSPKFLEHRFSIPVSFLYLPGFFDSYLFQIKPGIRYYFFKQNKKLFSEITFGYDNTKIYSGISLNSNHKATDWKEKYENILFYPQLSLGYKFIFWKHFSIAPSLSYSVYYIKYYSYTKKLDNGDLEIKRDQNKLGNPCVIGFNMFIGLSF